MKERPIIFSTEMVRAILDLKKTMTRRVIKPQPIYYEHGAWFEWERTKRDLNATYLAVNMPNYCPYGQVGGKLWVRETWWCPEKGLPVAYKANLEPHQVDKQVWKPSIFMPRWASRILLEITEVRAERLQEITAGDCTREGILYEDGDYVTMRVFEKFKELWDSLNAKRGYGWETNPWVWPISFKRLEVAQ